MNRSVYLVIVAIALTCSTTLASLYRWNPKNRPPVSLSDALAQAEKLLGDDARNRHCVMVMLWGDKSGEGKDGAWNLYYAAADGSQKQVYVPMRGESAVSLFNGPVEWFKEGERRESLEDIRKRLEKLFKEHDMVPDIELKDGVLRVKFLPRDFEIYPVVRQGEYEEKLVKVPGPKPHGFWLEIRKVDKPDHRDLEFDTRYWQWVRGTYLSTRKDEYFAVDFRYGQRLREDILIEMLDAFGKSMGPF